MRLYLDTNAIIYLVESIHPFQQDVRARVLQAVDHSGLILTSRLTRLECRVKPLRENNQSLLARYDAFFTRSQFQLCELDAPVIELATEYRARYGFKTPDAIQLASAKISRSDLFLTGDVNLARSTEINVE